MQPLFFGILKIKTFYLYKLQICYAELLERILSNMKAIKIWFIFLKSAQSA